MYSMVIVLKRERNMSFYIISSGVITPHAQRERSKVIGVGVHICIHKYMFPPPLFSSLLLSPPLSSSPLLSPLPPPLPYPTLSPLSSSLLPSSSPPLSPSLFLSSSLLSFSLLPPTRPPIFINSIYKNIVF